MPFGQRELIFNTQALDGQRFVARLGIVPPPLGRLRVGLRGSLFGHPQQHASSPDIRNPPFALSSSRQGVPVGLPGRCVSAFLHPVGGRVLLCHHGRPRRLGHLRVRHGVRGGAERALLLALGERDVCNKIPLLIEVKLFVGTFSSILLFGYQMLDQCQSHDFLTP